MSLIWGIALFLLRWFPRYALMAQHARIEEREKRTKQIHPEVLQEIRETKEVSDATDATLKTVLQPLVDQFIGQQKKED